jgi:hypothetical protein
MKTISHARRITKRDNAAWLWFPIQKVNTQVIDVNTFIAAAMRPVQTHSQQHIEGEEENPHESERRAFLIRVVVD